LTAAHFTESFDLILIDGDHSEQAVAHDTDMAYKLINRPGVIVWHDYEPQCPVYEYVNKLAHNGVHLGIRKITDTRFAYCKCV
jgi:predicted O-methyltransferase YrrM